MAAVDPADDNPLLRMADLADEVAFLRKSIIELAPLIPDGYCCTVDEDEALIVLRELKARVDREAAEKVRWAKASTTSASTKSSSGIGWAGAGGSISFPSREMKITLHSADPESERGAMEGTRADKGWYDESMINSVTSEIDQVEDAFKRFDAEMAQRKADMARFEKVLKKFTGDDKLGDLYD